MIGRLKLHRIRLVYLITGLVFISILGTSIVQLIAAHKAEKQSLYETTLTLNYESAQKMSMTMNTLFSSMKNSLGTMAEHVSKQSPPYNSLQADLDLFRRSSGYFNSVLIVSTDNTVRKVSPESVGFATANPKLTSKQTMEALESRKPMISNPYISSTNRLLLLITYPIFNTDGRYEGYVAGTVYLQEKNILNDIFGSFTGSDSYAYVVDKQGNLLYHPDKNRLGENVTSNKLVSRLMTGGQGYDVVINTLGIPFLAGYAISNENGWGIVVQTPLEVIEAESKELITKVLLYSLPLFLAILLLTLWLAKIIVAPFSTLAETAHKLVSGSRVSDLPKAVHWNYEAYHLNETILLTIETLQQRVDNFSIEALTDPLTGLANRRTMDSCLDEWIREQRPFAVLTFDIDHFKAVNDNYGHQTGDAVLKYVAEVVLSAIRKEDCCCRIGGEEFVVLLPDAPDGFAYKTAESIRIILERQQSPTGRPITVSLGVASYPYDASATLPILQCADQALYEAKRSGRNRTVMYTAEAV